MIEKYKYLSPTVLIYTHNSYAAIFIIPFLLSLLLPPSTIRAISPALRPHSFSLYLQTRHFTSKTSLNHIYTINPNPLNKTYPTHLNTPRAIFTHLSTVRSISNHLQRTHSSHLHTTSPTILHTSIPNNLRTKHPCSNYFQTTRRLLNTSNLAMSPSEKEWPSSKIRSTFVNFFEENGHVDWASSSVVPHNDPTLLFINSGMNQFKPLFLGTIDGNSAMAKLKRAANSQKCIRAGGKHNDLDDVGKDVYHHTFFEMLGSWSFGDYFKSEAINMAWKLLVEVYGISPDRLYVTYYGGDPKQPDCPPDEDARRLWSRYLPDERILPFGMKDNFWEMAETGPCGPCSEIHYDRIGGGRDAAHLVNMDDPDVLEIWNLVFMQFNRELGGFLKPLPAPCVDTGMGFERLVSVLQDVNSNYDTDVFKPIFDSITSLLQLPFHYGGKVGDEDESKIDMTFRIIADHIRCLTIAISDGAIPSNEGRGYVIRRILRRAIRYGHQYLNAPTSSPWFYKLVDSVLATNGVYFSDLLNNSDKVKEIIKDEEISFSKTLDRGVNHFKKIVKNLPTNSTFPGKTAFKLYTTYGFPLDLTEIMASEYGVCVDIDEYNTHFKNHQMVSQVEKNVTEEQIAFGPDEVFELSEKRNLHTTNDHFKYDFDTTLSDTPEHLKSTVLAIYDGNNFLDETTDQYNAIIFDNSNFYVEQGGQSGDTGLAHNDMAIFNITKVKTYSGYILHMGYIEGGSIKVGDTIELEVDWADRRKITINHSATHILNFALRKVLGGTCDQKGSLVAIDRFRFDFEHPKAITLGEIEQIQNYIKDMIRQDQKVYTQEIALSKARTIGGVRAVFGETYPDPVRVVCIGKPVDELLGDMDMPGQHYSIEFCGGTHITSTSEIKECVFVSESSISKGVRRVEMVTHQAALEVLKNDKLALQEMDILMNKDLNELSNISRLEDVKSISELELSHTTSKYIKDRFDTLMKAKLNNEKEKAKEIMKSAKFVGQDLAQKNSSNTFIITSFPEFNGNGKILDACIKAFTEVNNKTAAFFLTNGNNGLSAICVVPKETTLTHLNAVNWINTSLSKVGGQGGGSSTRAVGACRKVDNIEALITEAQDYANNHIDKQ